MSAVRSPLRTTATGRQMRRDMFLDVGFNLALAQEWPDGSGVQQIYLENAARSLKRLMDGWGLP